MSKVLKVLLALMMVAVLLTASVSAFAAESPTTKKIVTAKISSAVYTGKKLTPEVTVWDNDGNIVSPEYYQVTVKGKAKNAGSYKVTIDGKVPYTGTYEGTFKIWKAENPFKVTSTSFKRNLKKDQKVAIKVKNLHGAKLGRWSTNNPNVYVSGGKLVIKKGFAGTAKLSVVSTATKNYKATRKTVVITVKK